LIPCGLCQMTSYKRVCGFLSCDSINMYLIRLCIWNCEQYSRVIQSIISLLVVKEYHIKPSDRQLGTIRNLNWVQ